MYVQPIGIAQKLVDDLPSFSFFLLLLPTERPFSVCCGSMCNIWQWPRTPRNGGRIKSIPAAISPSHKTLNPFVVHHLEDDWSNRHGVWSFGDSRISILRSEAGNFRSFTTLTRARSTTRHNASAVRVREVSQLDENPNPNSPKPAHGCTDGQSHHRPTNCPVGLNARPQSTRQTR